jgi:hypothetical protein
MRDGSISVGSVGNIEAKIFAYGRIGADTDLIALPELEDKHRLK